MPIRWSILLAAGLLGVLIALPAWALAQSPTPAPTPAAPTAAPTATVTETATPTTAATADPALTPVATPTAEPTMTVPQFLDRVVSGDRPFEAIGTFFSQYPLWLGLGLLLLVGIGVVGAKPVGRWLGRIEIKADKSTGGERIDLQHEVDREQTKAEIARKMAEEQRQKQIPPGLEAYLTQLAREMRRLVKIPIGEKQQQLNIEQVYVPLDVIERDQIAAYDHYSYGEFAVAEESATREAAYAAMRESRPVFRLLSEPAQLPPPPPNDASPHDRLRPSRPDAPEPAQERTFERLLLIGRAGSGKTTTLQYGALLLARAARSGDQTEVRTNLQLFTEQNLFPIYARLTEVMNYIREHYAQRPAELVGAPAQLCLDALDELARRDTPALPEDALSERIKAGNCLLLLDGLDETGDDYWRSLTMDLITKLVDRFPANRYLVASRPFDRIGDRLPDFTEQHLRPLDSAGIRRLLNNLFLALRLEDDRTLPTEPDALVPEAADLWRNLQRNARLFDMATNPLLLTSMAIMVEGGKKLPTERAKIYKDLIELTIEVWRKRQLERDGVPKVKLFGELEDGDSVRLRLQLLAVTMLEQEYREISLEYARELLLPIYEENYPDWNDIKRNQYIRELLYQIALQSGLLQAYSSDKSFRFTHFTLQEYLAARYYVGKEDTKEDPAKTKAVTELLGHWHEARWRETILLAIGHEATTGSRATAQKMVSYLLEIDDPSALILAADALDEANAQAIPELRLQRLEACKRLRPLAALTDDWRSAAHPDPVLRARAATLLDRLGGDGERLGLDLTSPAYWAQRIAPGLFSMGDDNGPYDDEKPQFDYPIRRPYALAKFPVTNRQYQIFVEALAGRGDDEAKAAARQLRELMQQHGQTPADFQPRYWPGSSYRAGEGNHPVVGVTWYAATAFAWWADAWLRQKGLLAPGAAIRLPSEAEWERAAAYPADLSGAPGGTPDADLLERLILSSPVGDTRAGRRDYPWGAWDEVTESARDGIIGGIRANTYESGIRDTSAVGIFPHGAAACGAQELAGNVWEWCSTPFLKYPFRQEVQPESLYNQNKLSIRTYVLRGGSWANNRGNARCASRLGRLTASESVLYGFRLAHLFSLSSS